MNKLDLLGDNSTIYAANRIGAHDQELYYEVKKQRGVLQKAGDFLGVTETSLHKVIKTASGISNTHISNSQELDELQIANLKANLKSMEKIRDKTKEKKLFKCFPKLLYCASAEKQIQNLKVIQEARKNAADLSDSDKDSYHTAIELSDSDSYHSIEEDENKDDEVFYSDEENNPPVENVVVMEEEIFRPIALNDSSPYADAVADLANLVPGVASVMLFAFPKDVVSWKLDEKNNFIMEFSQSHQGTFYESVCTMNKTLKGTIDPKTETITFESGGIYASYGIIGANVTAISASKVNGKSHLSITGTKVWFSRSVTQPSDDIMEMLQTHLKWQ